MKIVIINEYGGLENVKSGNWAEAFGKQRKKRRGQENSRK